MRGLWLAVSDPGSKHYQGIRGVSLLPVCVATSLGHCMTVLELLRKQVKQVKKVKQGEAHP